MPNERLTRHVLLAKPTGKRPRGRPRTTWSSPYQLPFIRNIKEAVVKQYKILKIIFVCYARRRANDRECLHELQSKWLRTACQLQTSLQPIPGVPNLGVHVPPGVHLPIRRGTFKVINRRAKYICI